MSRSTVVGIVAVLLVLGGAAAIVLMVTGGREAAPSPPPGGPLPMPGGAMSPPPMPGGGAAKGGGAGAPGAPGGFGGPGGSGGGLQGGGLQQLITAAGGTEADAQKVQAYFEKRQGQTRELREALDKLRELAADEKTTDAQARQALADFQAKRDAFKQTLAAERKQLAADLNLAAHPRLEAALVVMGILDNGMPGLGARGRGGMGMGGGMGAPGGGGPGMGGFGSGGPGGRPGQGGPPPASAAPKGF